MLFQTSVPTSREEPREWIGKSSTLFHATLRPESMVAFAPLNLQVAPRKSQVVRRKSHRQQLDRSKRDGDGDELERRRRRRRRLERNEFVGAKANSSSLSVRGFTLNSLSLSRLLCCIADVNANSTCLCSRLNF